MNVTSTYDRVWEPSIWLPSGVNWDDVKGIRWPVASHLLYSIPVAICFIAVRYIVESYTLYPLARKFLGTKKPINKETSENSPHELILEEALKNKVNNVKFTHAGTISLAKKLDLEVRVLERWIRKRNKSSNELQVKKLAETGWRFLSYTLLVAGQLYILWDKNWLWDVSQCWSNYPYQNVTNDIWLFYIIMTGFYVSLSITLAFDVKRKDFWAMLVHHVVTISLYGFSWTSNFMRIGMIIAILHDVSDIFIEATKIFRYCKMEKLAKKTGYTFLLVWTATRLILYPFHLFNSVFINRPEILQTMTTYHVLRMSLLLLLGLNIFWTYFIVRMLVQVVATGKVEDTRSAGETEDESGHEVTLNNRRKDRLDIKKDN